MRFSALIGVLALAFSAGCDSSAAQNNATAAAPAAMTLRYASPERPEDRLTIERDGAGRIRAEEGNGQILIIRDGVTHMIFTPPGGGGQVVARLEDYVAIGAELRATLLREGVLTGGSDETRYTIREEGEATVGQWRGQGYRLSPEGSGVVLSLVISTDPALAEARALAVPVLQDFERIARAVLIYPEDYVRLSGELLGRGMPISYDGRALTSIGTEPVPAARFELPGPVLSRDALRARLMPAGRAQ